MKIEQVQANQPSVVRLWSRPSRTLWKNSILLWRGKLRVRSSLPTSSGAASLISRIDQHHHQHHRDRSPQFFNGHRASSLRLTTFRLFGRCAFNDRRCSYELDVRNWRCPCLHRFRRSYRNSLNDCSRINMNVVPTYPLPAHLPRYLRTHCLLPDICFKSTISGSAM
jgi:hypothetical protein